MNKPLHYAMNVLSVRDYSEVEIRRKCAAYLYKSEGTESEADEAIAQAAAEDVEAAIAYCKEHGWLDDARYARRYISSRSRKGYGVQRIRMELSQKGIDKATLTTALNESDIDWCMLAKSVVERKFGHPLSDEWKDKVKHQRYLLYRGFFHEEIQSIYTNFSD
ncbi:recombination regulator RecX [Pectobacterium atrosepticum]|uniref:recombination regulator RecX n=1 Tax=Pectobacterium atrosepticum TaxID=29471 RepID=UPI00039B126F|nr:recombination regulator RecX [Pectobacterium atrosepticum]GKV87809.1 regulatory protein RecX [Pectobacterium carotovorum subsp. carotovorum]AIA72188.1 RecX family transcriptional regulator [Pectobacterium atrosepticum]AIK15157.1 regulatory protein RecX [Pectobacterium atrosepticum]ATY91925.1 recombination regulator RecX [Pectobacterium atrosepticum]KFX12734.1 RecX family transcriptional regulator [Pectobacterium atrosepticum]